MQGEGEGRDGVGVAKGQRAKGPKRQRDNGLKGHRDKGTKRVGRGWAYPGARCRWVRERPGGAVQ